MLSGTLQPTADMWVAIHLNKANGDVNRVYGPFDNWSEAREFVDRMPGDQPMFTHILPVRGVK